MSSDQISRAISQSMFLVSSLLRAISQSMFLVSSLLGPSTILDLGNISLAFSTNCSAGAAEGAASAFAAAEVLAGSAVAEVELFEAFPTGFGSLTEIRLYSLFSAFLAGWAWAASPSSSSSVTMPSMALRP